MSLYPNLNFIISHSDKTKISEIINNFCKSKNIIINKKKYTFFNTIRPIPNDIINTENNKSWCLNNWGSEYDLYDFTECVINEDKNNNKIIIIKECYIPIIIHLKKDI